MVFADSSHAKKTKHTYPSPFGKENKSIPLPLGEVR